MRLVWIVEMMDEDKDGWAPCNGSGLNIEDGKIELANQACSIYSQITPPFTETNMNALNYS